MKHIIRNIAGVIMITIVFLSSCKQDQTLEEETTLTIRSKFSGKHVQGKEFLNHNKQLKRFLNSQFERSSKDISSSTYGFTIQTDDIQVIESNTYTSYTFKVIRDTYDFYTTENYILTVYNDGSYSQLLATYPLEEVNGKLTYNLQTATVENIIDSSLLYSKSTQPCTGTMQELVEWDASAGDCINFRCRKPTGDGTHGPGQNCNAQGDDRAYQVCSGAWVVTDCIQIGGGSTGGSGPFSPPAGGGNNDPNESDPSEEEVPLVPIIPAWQQIVNCMDSHALGGLNGSSQAPLSASEIVWLQQASRLILSPMLNYLDDNSCGNHPVDFNNIAIDNLVDGHVVDYEDTILYDSIFSATRPCQKDIIKKSYSTQSPLATSILQTFDTSDKLHLNFKEAQLGDDTSATTGDNPDLINCSDTACVVDVFFDTEFLNEATDMAIAVTTLHESIHAMFLNWAKNNEINLPADGIELNYPNLLKVYLAYIEDGDGSDYGTVHHTELVQFIGQITIALMQYGEDNGYELDQSYYSQLAWYGLHGTPEFDLLYPENIDHDNDPQTPEIENVERIRILLLLQAERNTGGGNQTVSYTTSSGETITVTQKGSPCQ